MTWLEAAEEYTKLAKEAERAGDLVVFAVAIQKAAECVQIACNLAKAADARSQKVTP